jgi:hypothetical protein
MHYVRWNWGGGEKDCKRGENSNRRRDMKEGRGLRKVEGERQSYLW